MARRFTIRAAAAEEAEPCARLLAACFEPPTAAAAEIALWLQTGAAVFVAEDREIRALVRLDSAEGIDTFDLLCSAAPGAGAALLRHLEAHAQDRGVRQLRTLVPEGSVLEEYFARKGYLPIAREVAEDGEPMLLVERRVPLLTVRELRRSDAADLARLTGRDPWDFQYALRPGWFVLADGDRFGGYVRVRDTGHGHGEVSVPVVGEAYAGRSLELWMIERAVYYAETHGFRTLEVAAHRVLEPLRAALEEAGWTADEERFVRSLSSAPSYRAAEPGLSFPPD